MGQFGRHHPPNGPLLLEPKHERPNVQQRIACSSLRARVRSDGRVDLVQVEERWGQCLGVAELHRFRGAPLFVDASCESLKVGG